MDRGAWRATICGIAKSQTRLSDLTLHSTLSFNKVKVLLTQSCPTLCDPMDRSPLGSSVHGTLQARILEWIANPFSRGSSQPRDRTQVSHVTGGFFTTEPPGKPINILSANKKIDAHVDSISQCLLRLPCYYLF